jgi:hypothetical protein
MSQNGNDEPKHQLLHYETYQNPQKGLNKASNSGTRPEDEARG